MKPGRSTAMAVWALVIWTAPVLCESPRKPLAANAIEAFQGELVELRVIERGLSAAQAKLGRDVIRFYPDEDGFFSALIGIDLEAAPGSIKVLVKTTTVAGAQRQIPIGVRVTAKSFPSESFAVPPEFEPLSPDVLERVQREQEQLAQLFAVATPRRLWGGPFLPPISSDVTSPFGFRRVINGIPRAPHGGVDLRALLGTEVLAANHARVALVGDFFFGGKTLVLDHGAGLYTMYLHLAQLKVDAGMEVKKGDLIALSGMTGRVTGPHLHWGARLNGARIDPFELVVKLARKGAPAGASSGSAGGGEN